MHLSGLKALEMRNAGNLACTHKGNISAVRITLPLGRIEWRLQSKIQINICQSGSDRKCSQWLALSSASK